MTVLFPNTSAIPTGWGGWRVDGYPVSGLVTSEFGASDDAHPEPHSGTDIAADYGTPVCNPFGKPVLVRDVFVDTIRGTAWDGFKNIFGNAVILESDGYISLFAHLRDTVVVEGQLLAPGAVLGHVGSTGQSTGPHLHWGLAPALFNGQPSYLPRVDCLNPLAYVSNASPSEVLPGGEFLPEDEPLRPPFNFFSDPIAARWAQSVEERLSR